MSNEKYVEELMYEIHHAGHYEKFIETMDIVKKECSNCTIHDMIEKSYTIVKEKYL